MATEQALIALISLYRQQNNMNTYFDMRKEINYNNVLETEKFIINIIDINSCNSALNSYNSLNFYDRKYIKNYNILKQSLILYNISENNCNINSLGTIIQNETTKFIFSEKNLEEYNDLLKINEISTKYYSRALKLQQILSNCIEFDKRDDYLISINNLLFTIKNIELKINNINESISKLYPYNDITLKDSQNINNLLDNYATLTSYDQKQIVDYDYLIRCKTKIKNIKMTFIISAIIIILLAYIFNIINNKYKETQKK